MNHFEVNENSSNEVVNLQNFRTKKLEEQSLVRGREPLYMSHGVRGLDSDSKSDKNLSDFSDRISNIKRSLDRINLLMNDLKKL